LYRRRRRRLGSAEPLPTSEEIKLEQFRGWLKKHQRNIKLPQLLIEVDNELHFTRHFLPPVYHCKNRPVDEICAIIAAVMANGCNIGPETMAKLTPGVTYQQIKRITDWQLTQETQRSALAVVVNAIANLSITQNWGEGKTLGLSSLRIETKPAMASVSPSVERCFSKTTVINFATMP